jgi:methylmalonyl-CoA mutase N-terminal domain/subunit
MNAPHEPLPPAGLDDLAQRVAQWQKAYDTAVPAAEPTRNRSGIELKPLYTPLDWAGQTSPDTLGVPGEFPFTRGIYASMYRGRSWSQRQLVGLGVPEDYNARVKELLALGASALSFLPCNSVFRGYDADEVPAELLGTCGTVVNHVQDMERAFEGVPIGDISTALNDPAPFTLLAFELALAKKRGVPWARITGTSNQSDSISHFVANHMFFRIALPGARRIVVDHIQFANRTPAGLEPAVHRRPAHAAGRRHAGTGHGLHAGLGHPVRRRLPGPRHGPGPLPAALHLLLRHQRSACSRKSPSSAPAAASGQSLCRDRFGAKDPRSWRFKFHGQTSGVDLTRQQPLNNMARVTVQAMAGILGGLQSLHTDSYDEVFSTPTAEAARIAVATQNILREEAQLTDVIDPLGGSYYVESLTDAMEAADPGAHRENRRRRRHGRCGAAGPGAALDRRIGTGLPEQGGVRPTDHRGRQRLPGGRRSCGLPGAGLPRCRPHAGLPGRAESLQGAAQPGGVGPGAGRFGRGGAIKGSKHLCASGGCRRSRRHAWRNLRHAAP